MSTTTVANSTSEIKSDAQLAAPVEEKKKRVKKQETAQAAPVGITGMPFVPDLTIKQISQIVKEAQGVKKKMKEQKKAQRIAKNPPKQLSDDELKKKKEENRAKMAKVRAGKGIKKQSKMGN
jgi:hypothetical protein